MFVKVLSKKKINFYEILSRHIILRKNHYCALYMPLSICRKRLRNNRPIICQRPNLSNLLTGPNLFGGPNFVQYSIFLQDPTILSSILCVEDSTSWNVSNPLEGPYLYKSHPFFKTKHFWMANSVWKTRPPERAQPLRRAQYFYN